jgi:hypothetical protein
VHQFFCKKSIFGYEQITQINLHCVFQQQDFFPQHNLLATRTSSSKKMATPSFTIQSRVAAGEAWVTYDVKSVDFVGSVDDEQQNKPNYPSRTIVCVLDDSGSTNNNGGMRRRFAVGCGGGAFRPVQLPSGDEEAPLIPTITKYILVAETEAMWRAVAHISRRYNLEGVYFAFYAFSDTLRVIFDTIVLDKEYAATLYKMAQEHPRRHVPEFGSTRLLSSMTTLLKITADIPHPIELILATDGHPTDLIPDNMYGTVESVIATRKAMRGIIIGAGSISCSQPGVKSSFSVRNGKFEKVDGSTSGTSGAAFDVSKQGECDLAYLHGLATAFHGGAVYAPACTDYSELEEALTFFYNLDDADEEKPDPIFFVQGDAFKIDLPQGVCKKISSVPTTLYKGSNGALYACTQCYQLCVELVPGSPPLAEDVDTEGQVFDARLPWDTFDQASKVPAAAPDDPPMVFHSLSDNTRVFAVLTETGLLRVRPLFRELATFPAK